ncbi:MAG: hypothetical protein IRZ31_01145 [Thermogemmatispora sp.]|uniref:hypothetical protein n=1 Tax=Thermogemmatispora sp. TaxID=1968838 RepID=UPI00261EF89C|nr:hypothetical protein [Thermogemmatispora sp.]MBX5455477.1 hypothetical protein [Thermogemmatispora sp.]
MTQVPSDHEAEPQEALVDLTKKLRKRERRLLQRLQKAQTARAKAVERLNRAQARLEKRTARLQRLEERLSLVRQQLQTLESLTEGAPASAPQPQVETTSSLPGTASSVGEAEEDREQAMPPSAEREAAAPGISTEIGETASGNPALKELQALTHLLLEEGRREEQLRASWGRSGLASPSPADTAEGVTESSTDQPSAAFEPAGTAWHAFDQDLEAAPGGQRPPEPDWVSQLAAGENGAVSLQKESLSAPLAHVAEEGASSAPAAPEQTSQQASSATEARQASPAPPSVERPRQAALYGFDEPPELPEAESDDEEADFSPVTPAVLASSLLPASPAELVREARAAAEAAEEAARLAIERAALAAARLELLPSGRHLTQELAEVEQAVAQASHAAEVAQMTAREVEHWAQAIAPAADDLDRSAPAQNAAVSPSVETERQQEQNEQTPSSESDTPARTEEAALSGASTAVQPGSEMPALSPEAEPAEAISLPEEEQAGLETAPPQEEERREPGEAVSAAQAAPPAALLLEQAAEAMAAGKAVLAAQEGAEPMSDEEEASPEAETATSPEVTAPSEIATVIPEPSSGPVEAEESTAGGAAQTNAPPESEAREDHEEVVETATTAHQEKGEQEESFNPEAPLQPAGQEAAQIETLSAEATQTASEAEESERS